MTVDFFIRTLAVIFALVLMAAALLTVCFMFMQIIDTDYANAAVSLLIVLVTGVASAALLNFVDVM